MEPPVFVHGTLGATALVAGLVAAAAPKRAGLHVLSGRIFAVAMLVSLVAIAIPIVTKTNVVMLGLGTVAGFSIIEGWRGLRRMRGTLQGAPDLVDYILVGTTGVIAAGLAVFSGFAFWRTGNPLSAVGLAFAGLAAVLLRASVGRWSEEMNRKRWLAVHIGHMAGALGAAVTAAAIVNLENAFGSAQWILWIAPTVVSTVWGQWTIRKRGLG